MFQRRGIQAARPADAIAALAVVVAVTTTERRAGHVKYRLSCLDRAGNMVTMTKSAKPAQTTGLRPRA